MKTSSLSQVKPATNFRWVVLALIFAVYAVNYADRSNIGSVLPFITEEFNMTNFEAGQIASMFFLGYAICQIPAGFLLAKRGVRGIVTLSILGFSAFTWLIGTASSALSIKWLRLGLGITEAPTPVGLTSTINNWFPPKEKATATGIYIASTMFAPILVPPLVVWISLTFGWRWVFFLFAIPGLLLAVIWYFLVKSRPEESKFVSPSELKYIRASETESGDEVTIENIVQHSRFATLDKIIRVREIKPLDSAARIFRSRNVWGNTIAYFMMVSIMYGILTWIPSYLVNEKGFSFVKMGFVAAMPFIGGFIGSIFGGWISDNIFGRRRKPTMIFTALATILMMVVMIHVPQSTAMVAGALFMVGLLLNIGWPSFTAYPMGVVDRKNYPIAISLVNSGGNLGGFVSPMAAGYLLDKTGQFSSVFTYFGICAVIGLVLLLIIDEPK
ncbi:MULTISPECIES: MFS transporter [Pantoea]|uniref:MFS transporter n=1 Tax=Pantoea allii TaxID=574096 RepID=A0ABS6VBR2_9GAMM|nr:MULTISPECIES: MFS transporter [Pantoea]MBW1212947.1 MFS transporter [Pantoea allii]MBW1256735.1 MFS transporter [Pantoea allii]MBW1265619.1 MFS transporter [Pantoea allii]MBW1287929.1 MFS transporter [Pantoea allii]TWD44120.1 sugar phosphate permease [Pantoea sp. SJZ147]